MSELDVSRTISEVMEEFDDNLSQNMSDTSLEDEKLEQNGNFRAQYYVGGETHLKKDYVCELVERHTYFSRGGIPLPIPEDGDPSETGRPLPKRKGLFEYDEVDTARRAYASGSQVVLVYRPVDTIYQRVKDHIVEEDDPDKGEFRTSVTPQRWTAKFSMQRQMPVDNVPHGRVLPPVKELDESEQYIDRRAGMLQQDVKSVGQLKGTGSCLYVALEQPEALDVLALNTQYGVARGDDGGVRAGVVDDGMLVLDVMPKRVSRSSYKEVLPIFPVIR